MGNSAGGTPSPSNWLRGRDGSEDQPLRQQPEKKEPKPGEEKQGDPKDDASDRTEPEQADGRRKPDGDTAAFERKDTSGDWGKLPPKVQELLRQYSDDQLPPRYRRLIESYYKLESKRAKDEARRTRGG